ncbi:MAG TPA: hypothetical protein VKB50_22435 [Vicinamibacterales bacterium]|nr:hypothetical protein [Vicinamibacterales bacterium]
MTARACAGLVVLLVLGGDVSPAGAHRLDEYLQATRVAIDPDRIALEIDLTAGANIASRIVELIDTNRDGRLSQGEQDDYARQVLTSITCSIDGHLTPSTLLTRQFPELEAMAAGTGPIRLRAAVDVSPGSGRHQLDCVNTHAPEMSVYLVNALMPSDTRVRIGPPHRDPFQRELSLDFDIAPDTFWFQAGWSIVACVVIGSVLRSRSERVPRNHVAEQVRFRRTVRQS